MTALGALQDCLAAEHASLYGYGVLGGVLAGVAAGSADGARAEASYTAHRARRDALVDLIAGLGADPVAAEPAYRIPFEVGSREACRSLARALEHTSCAVYAFAVSQTVEGTRAVVAQALTEDAVREYGWGGRPQAFPGL